MKECKRCGAEVTSKSNNAKFCSIECRDKTKFEENQKELLKGIEGLDYVIDRWNGYVTPRIFGKWMAAMHPGKTTAEYRQQFPDAKLQCDKISAKLGQYMKEPYHRERQRMAMVGNNNPNHSSKTTKEQRQAKSPFSTKFVKYKSDADRWAFIETVDYGAIKKSSDIAWWIEKCDGDVELAQKLYAERQKTFTLEKCIKRYGEEKGTRVFNDRQEKWLKSFPKTNYSKVSQQLFVRIYESIKNNFNEIYFATLNGENILEFNNGKNYEYTLKLKNITIKPDFFVKDIGKIIEFDGVYWHRKNPENKKREAKRDKAIIESGYEVFHVNESEYNEDPDKVIRECINFLNG